MIARTPAQPSMTTMKPVFKSIILFALSLPFSIVPAYAAKVLFLHGGRSHASGDHEFRAGSHLLAKHFNAQKKVSIQASIHAGWPKDESILDGADAIVIYADGTSVIGKGWEKMDQLVKKKKVGGTSPDGSKNSLYGSNARETSPENTPELGLRVDVSGAGALQVDGDAIRAAINANADLEA